MLIVGEFVEAPPPPPLFFLLLGFHPHTSMISRDLTRAVAAPELLPEELCAASVQLVQVHPGEAVKLQQGTWHAGPFFHAPSALFYNLELGDTNLTDHNFQALTAPIKLMLDPSLSSPSS